MSERGVSGKSVLGARPPPALSTLTPRHRAAPHDPPYLPYRAGSFQHRGQRLRLPPDPAKWPRQRSHGPDALGAIPHSARQGPPGASTRCLGCSPGCTGASSGSVPWLAKVTGGDGRSEAGSNSRSSPSSRSPSAPALDFYLSVSCLTVLLLPLFPLTPGLSASPHILPPAPTPSSPWPCFHTCRQLPHSLQSRSCPKGQGFRLQGNLWETPPWGSSQGREAKSAPACHFGRDCSEWELRGEWAPNEPRQGGLGSPLGAEG